MTQFFGTVRARIVLAFAVSMTITLAVGGRAGSFSHGLMPGFIGWPARAR
jgi:hypothetical protein